MSEKVLFVDDDPVILDFYRDYLERQFEIETALSGTEALELLRNRGPYAVLVADMKMPEMNGIELLTEARRVAPDMVRLMLTADAERETAVDAINRGHIFQFLGKPCAPEMLVMALEAAIKQYQLIVSERELIEKTLSGSIKMLTEVLSAVEPESFGLGQKVREAARPLAEKLGFTQVWELEIAALLCGLGHVTIPPATMQRVRVGGNLSVVERGMLARVPEFGRNLLQNIPRLEKVAELVYLQQKNFDGSGFPPGSMNGDAIPEGARILRVLLDMCRLELEGVPRVQALSKMREKKGIYDLRIVTAALESFLQDRLKQGRAVTLGELAVGHVLLSAIETNEGMLIAPAETRISQMLLEKLRNFTELSAIREPIYVQV